MSAALLGSLQPATIPSEDEALRSGIRAFLTARTAGMPAERRARSWSGFDRDFSKALGAEGFLGVTFPETYGGQARSPFARYVITEELLNIGAPVAAHWIGERQSGPLLLKYGTEDQKRHFLPPICRGESVFCIGMSEPNAGSDLASVGTRAMPQGDGWLLNGQKIWTTHGHEADYMIALVRTSGGPADRQKGLSQLLVDLSLPGVTCRPITDLTGDTHFSEVFFENVELGPDALVGTEGEGWSQVMSELAFERSGSERFYSTMVLFEEWLGWIRSLDHVGPQSEALAGSFVSRLASIRALSLSITEKLCAGESPVIEAALVKEMGTTLEQDIVRAIADDVAARPHLPLPASLIGTLHFSTLAAPSYSLRGGTREILLGMIARGLGLR